MNASSKKTSPPPLKSPGLSHDDQAIALEIAKLPQSQKAQLAMQFLGINKKSLTTEHNPITVESRKAPLLAKINPKLVEGILAELVKELDLKPTQRPKSQQKERPPTAKPAPNLQKTGGPSMESANHVPRQPVKINALLSREHPCVAAFVLSSQSTEKAAELLQKLHPVRAQKIALALSDIECKRRRFPKKSGNIIHHVSRLA